MRAPILAPILSPIGSHSSRPARLGTAVALAGLLTVTGCSLGHKSSPAPELAPGESAVSPGGVTTEVNAPAKSTEEEYMQACLQARGWMDGQTGDRHALIEAYLGRIQQPGPASGVATWNTPWAELSPERQSALIVAVRAAADEACG